MSGWAATWQTTERKWSLCLLNAGVMRMTVALLIAGYEQSFIERALEGSTWQGYFAARNHSWLKQATKRWAKMPHVSYFRKSRST
jgi:hypothetical protein